MSPNWSESQMLHVVAKTFFFGGCAGAPFGQIYTAEAMVKNPVAILYRIKSQLKQWQHLLSMHLHFVTIFGFIFQVLCICVIINYTAVVFPMSTIYTILNRFSVAEICLRIIFFSFVVSLCWKQVGWFD